MNTVISVILFLIILIALYKMYYYVNPKLLVDDSVINLNQTTPIEIKIDSYEDPNGVRYFYDGWFRINQIQNNDKNHILFRRGHKFVVSLRGHELGIFQISAQNNITTEGTWTDNTNTPVTIISHNFPFQKWTYFCINVEGNQIDTYLDGKLSTSIKGKDISNKAISGSNLDFTEYANEESNIKVGNEYTIGRLARFRREIGNMDPQSVWNTYMLGPGVNDNGDENNPDYHAKIALLRNGKPRQVLNIF